MIFINKLLTFINVFGYSKSWNNLEDKRSQSFIIDFVTKEMTTEFGSDILSYTSNVYLAVVDW